ncbi:protein crumbs homolog 1 isoform X2 [Ambystoma mexicanum]|uniref:protein crumbs homolog 1 isoform X2 n=1 Tax=Ambystoma mexicanum TaxID=8296 RepID=UPI0037E75D7A
MGLSGIQPLLIVFLMLLVQPRRSLCVRNDSRCLGDSCQKNATVKEAPEDGTCHCGGTSVDARAKDCDRDPCASGPCPQNSTCLSGAGNQSYTCQCGPGHAGSDCQAAVTLCHVNHCRGGSRCLVGPAGPHCECQAGYTGALCETDINECESNPCHNGALCLDGSGGYACFCVPGFQGKHCDIEVNECASEPCRHGATCLNKIGSYACLCQLEYTGINCELEIDECLSEPCRNGATCLDHFGSYSCSCAPGFLGDLCEINVDECASQPCLQGGQCVDDINGYSCNCSSTEFMGLHCENPIPLCWSQPCHHHATCHDTDGSYTCQCWPGYTGPQCETDISECSSSPCLAAGECVELSWADRYGTIPELPPAFRHQQAAGYVCHCQPGFTGLHCEQDIDECVSGPCQHGGTCENLPGSYACHCPAEGQEGIVYGGSNCTDILTGCTENRCQNGGLCIPHLNNGEHGYLCQCPSGYTDLNCGTMTTFTFDGSGFVHVTSSVDVETQALFNITLKFQTALPTALILHRGTADTFLKLGLQRGYLYLSLHVYSQLKTLLHIWQNMSDGEWHAVEVTLERAVTLKILDSSCTAACVNTSTGAVRSSPLTLAFQSTFLGGVPAAGMRDGAGQNANSAHPEPWFIGCLLDIHIDSNITTPEAVSSERSLNVKTGCHRKEWCEGRPCQNRGRCVNLWQSYQCDCYRPYVGPNCSREFTPGRFGQEDSAGYAAFFAVEMGNESVTVSMFVRTRQSSGLLLALRNSASPSLMIWLEHGKLVLSAQSNLRLSGKRQVNDGDFHLISLKIEQNKADLFQASEHLGGVSLSSQRGNYTLHIGGLPDQQETNGGGGYFKGCVQDVRLNANPLEFFPLSSSEEAANQRALVNVTRGCSGDNLCQPNPCQNGGVCYSIWDDYTCTCPPNTAGRACEEVRWCELRPCPPESRCQAVHHGFECVATASFNGKNSIISYRSNGKITRDLTNVTFGFRTRDSEVVLLHAEKEPEFITIGIRQSKLLFQLQSGNSFYVLRLASPQRVNDGKWHRVALAMTDPLSQSSRWHMEIDEPKDLVTSTVSTGNLNFLRDETDIYLGDRASDDAAALTGCLTGCLSTLQLGAIHLPYMDDAALRMKKPQEEQFLKTSPSPVAAGCLQADACESDPCMHGGGCQDLYSTYQCACPQGWVGAHCEINLDECLSDPCVHGNCSDRVGSYVCTCERGYTGAHCEQDVDNCLGHQCPNGATCIDGTNSYSCLCPGNFTGKFCNVYSLPEASALSVVRIHSRLPTSFCGNDKRNLTCYNYGNCTEIKNELRCICLPGFMGERCEIDIDECQSDPCLNGGLCQNLPNRFHCICDVNFAGDRCEIDLTDDAMSRVFTALAAVILALFFIFCVGLCAFVAAASMRASQGTYSPSRQEKEGSRVEMWDMVQPPPIERLI